MKNKLRVVFFGSGDFPSNTLSVMMGERKMFEIVGVVTTNYKSFYGEEHIASIASRNSVPCYVQKKDDADMERLAAWLKELRPDVFCVISYKFLPASIRDIAKFSFNVHASLLPWFRGAAPIHWVIRTQCEVMTGLTAFVLNDKIDCGNVILKEPVAVDEHETYHTLFHKLSGVCPAFTMEVMKHLWSDIDNVETRRQTLLPEVCFDAYRAPKITAQMTDFNGFYVPNDNDGLYAAIRASQEGYTFHFIIDPLGEPLTLKVYEAELVTDEIRTIFNGSDGKPIGYPVVQTDGKTYIKVRMHGNDDTDVSFKTVQLPCRKKMTVQQFLAGCHPLHNGLNKLKIDAGYAKSKG